MTYEIGQQVDLIVDAEKWTRRVFGGSDPGCTGMRVTGTVTDVSDVDVCVQPPGSGRSMPFAIVARLDEILGNADEFDLVNVDEGLP